MLVAKKTRPELPEVEHIPLRDLPIDDIWRRHAKAAIKKLGINQYILADHIGSTQSNISQQLSTKMGQARSLHAERISFALGIRLTLPARAELAVARLMLANPELAESTVDNLVKMAAAVSRT